MKRLLGRRHNEPSVQNDLIFWPFKVIADAADKPMVVVTYKGKEKHFSAEEISSMVLTKIKHIAEVYLGSADLNAIMTVPTYFNDSQLQATKEVATIAGLNVIRIVNEVTAVAIAYGLDKGVTKKVLIFDFGGGMCHMTVATIGGNSIEVRADLRDAHLGGHDLDNRMVVHFVKEINSKTGEDIGADAKAIRTLKSSCESAKRHLSSAVDTSTWSCSKNV